MGVVLIKCAWSKNFRARYCYNPTIVIILDPPLLMHRVHTATTMAIDRGRRSINKLTGTVFAAVSCCILATCALQISASKNELLNDT